MLQKLIKICSDRGDLILCCVYKMCANDLCDSSWKKSNAVFAIASTCLLSCSPHTSSLSCLLHPHLPHLIFLSASSVVLLHGVPSFCLLFSPFTYQFRSLLIPIPNFLTWFPRLTVCFLKCLQGIYSICFIFVLVSLGFIFGWCDHLVLWGLKS